PERRTAGWINLLPGIGSTLVVTGGGTLDGTRTGLQPRVQARGRSGSGGRGEAAGPGLPRARARRRAAAALAPRIRGAGRGGLRAAPTVGNRGPAAADRRPGAPLRSAGPGERHPKKGVGQLPRAERHAMIAQAQRDHPGLSVRRLCALLGVARSWYYERPGRAEKVERHAALRDAIERIVLACPGYGYRRVTKAL